MPKTGPKNSASTDLGHGDKSSKSNQEQASDSGNEASEKQFGKDGSKAGSDDLKSKESASLKPKTKKKKKTGGHGPNHHHKGFKISKGYHIFGRSSPLPEGFVEEDIVTHVSGKKPLLGKVLKREDGICVRYRCYNYGIEYKPGDAVYIESNRPECPFYICAIQVSSFLPSNFDSLKK